MPRFFITPDSVPGDTVRITGDDAHHIARSLRMAVGDSITVADGTGKEYLCRLSEIRDDAVSAQVLSRRDSRAEPKTNIRLFMAYPKGDKLETVIMKAVELGATRITPFESTRCIKRPPEEKRARLAERHNRIAEEAAKQCGRAILPTVDEPVTFPEALALAREADLALFCYEGEGTASLKSVLPETPPKTCAILVGAEGGFSEAEAKAAKDAGLSLVGLGPRILRCETAPDYVLSSLSFVYELGK